MKEYLSQKGVPFEEINIRENPDGAMELMRRGSRGTPTILVGDEMVIGFDKGRLDTLLGL